MTPSDPAPNAAPAPIVRTVLVTGAARRLGREMAVDLARAGWQVAVHYRGARADADQTVADCAAASPKGQALRHAAFQADLADEAEVRALLPAVVAELGPVDAVVNNASTFEQDSVHDFGFALMERHWRSNTAAPIILAQALHVHLAARKAGPRSGVVVNLLDQKLWNLNPDFLSYTLSKAALETANTVLAQALAPMVRVVGVAPGLTITSHLMSDAEFEARHKLSPLQRSSTAADVTAAVRFALDNPAITGTTLLVDGGQHLMKFDRDFSVM